MLAHVMCQTGLMKYECKCPLDGTLFIQEQMESTVKPDLKPNLKPNQTPSPCEETKKKLMQIKTQTQEDQVAFEANHLACVCTLKTFFANLRSKVTQMEKDLTDNLKFKAKVITFANEAEISHIDYLLQKKDSFKEITDYKPSSSGQSFLKYVIAGDAFTVDLGVERVSNVLKNIFLLDEHNLHTCSLETILGVYASPDFNFHMRLKACNILKNRFKTEKKVMNFIVRNVIVKNLHVPEAHDLVCGSVRLIGNDFDESNVRLLLDILIGSTNSTVLSATLSVLKRSPSKCFINVSPLLLASLLKDFRSKCDVDAILDMILMCIDYHCSSFIRAKGIFILQARANEYFTKFAHIVDKCIKYPFLHTIDGNCIGFFVASAKKADRIDLAVYILLQLMQSASFQSTAIACGAVDIIVNFFISCVRTLNVQHFMEMLVSHYTYGDYTGYYQVIYSDGNVPVGNSLDFSFFEVVDVLQAIAKENKCTGCI